MEPNREGMRKLVANNPIVQGKLLVSLRVTPLGGRQDDVIEIVGMIDTGFTFWNAATCPGLVLANVHKAKLGTLPCSGLVPCHLADGSQMTSQPFIVQVQVCGTEGNDPTDWCDVPVLFTKRDNALPALVGLALWGGWYMEIDGTQRQFTIWVPT